MGNNNSSASKPTSPTSGTESPRATRREGRSIIPHATTQRSAAPPEASLALAQGSTTTGSSRPKSRQPSLVDSLSNSPHNLSSAAVPASQPPAPPPPASSSADAGTTKPRPSDEPSKPVDVPVMESSSLVSHHSTHAAAAHQAQAADPMHLMSHNSLTDMYLSRPPRLPLPIDEEVHTPGSPILGVEDRELGHAADIPEADLGEAVDAMTRKSSALSATTVDDEDAEELRVDRSRSVVPTKLEWKRGGDKVYVTGTIFQWNRKQRLSPVEGKPGCFAVTINILPGTHHVRFLVDGIMQTSPDLPTTVDFGNNLVNYIEVSPDDIPKPHAAPSAAPSAASTAPASGSAKAKSDAGSEPSASRTSSQVKEASKAPRTRAVLPAKSYREQVPQYLLDFDQAEESQAYQNAIGAIDKLPTPPSLPGFLGKPILNAATLMKDDNSVLNMPNHTVLNHLATSSIKNNVLAVSATTRYRDKYVTTIIHKPSTLEDA